MANFRSRPNPQADNFASGGPSRAGRYGEAYALAIGGHRDLFAVDEGSAFVAISPTAGTGILGHAAPTTFDELKPYLSVFNNGQNRIYPQFLRLYETVAGVGHTRIQFTVALDNIDRRTSGGTALTINNLNMDEDRTSGATIYAGAITAPAASGSRRLVGNYPVRGTIDIVEDVYELVWGHAGAATSNHSRVATVASHGVTLPSMSIGPGDSLLVHQWAGSQTTGPTWEVVFSYIER